MNVSIQVKNQEIDLTFIDTLHQAAQKTGLSQGRDYLVISEGKLGLTSKKSEEVTFEKLTLFVNEKLKGLTEQETLAVKTDLSKIEAKYNRQNNVKFNLSSDVLRQTMGFLTLEDVVSSKKVSTEWAKNINLQDQRIWKNQIKATAFGAEKWNIHYGDVGQEPLITKEMMEFIKQPNPYRPEKIRAHTGRFFLMPATVDKKPFTQNSFGELIKHPKQGNATRYRIWNQVSIEHGDKQIEKSYWAWMSNDVIHGSRNKRYAEQQQLLKAGDSVPTLLEAIVCILTEYKSTGTTRYVLDNIYTDTYTACLEQVGGYQTVVGGFAPADGLYVNGRRGFSVNTGVAALRKFF